MTASPPGAFRADLLRAVGYEWHLATELERTVRLLELVRASRQAVETREESEG